MTKKKKKKKEEYGFWTVTGKDGSYEPTVIETL